jgi:hypothetical protein
VVLNLYRSFHHFGSPSVLEPIPESVNGHEFLKTKYMASPEHKKDRTKYLLQFHSKVKENPAYFAPPGQGIPPPHACMH